MRYLYQIAGLRVLCEIPYPLTIHKESEAFLFPLPDEQMLPEIDLTFRFCPVESLPAQRAAPYSVSCREYVEMEDAWYVYHCATPHAAPYACVVWPLDGSQVVTCWYLPGKEHYLNFSRNIGDLLGLETLLWHWNGLLLHASFIRWNGQGILFSAPSGTGKSTQADLWVRYKGAEILNGDRAALRRCGRQWTAYGLPYAGSSGIYRNECAPVAALVVLRQAADNRIRPLSAVEAVCHLYPEITIHRWDRRFTEQALHLLTQLLADVPVYLLECRPDREAVEMLGAVLETMSAKGEHPCDENTGGTTDY